MFNHGVEELSSPQLSETNWITGIKSLNLSLAGIKKSMVLLIFAILAVVTDPSG